MAAYSATGWFAPHRWVSRYLLLLCGLLWTALSTAYGQLSDSSIFATEGLVSEENNVIHNADHLEAIFESLYQRSQGGEGQINIVHIGDSHVQADYMTHIVRRKLHERFGNAGRGLIVPLRVAGTNEPTNFKTASNVAWNSKRCVFPAQPLPIGVGGITIESTDPAARLEIYMNDLWLDYSFNELTLFYENDDASFDFLISDVDGMMLAKVEHEHEAIFCDCAHVSWPEKVNAVAIQMVKSSPGQERAVLYGIALENSMPGVVYHTIGVNGARYKHYREAKYFAAQTAILNPDLFIISLGTNEAIDYPFLDRNFIAEVDGLVSALRRNNPAAKFLLVTPQATFLQRNKTNPGIGEVRATIVQYAVENGLAFYDMYRAMGGAVAAPRWRAHDLLSADGIHLTRNGYAYQGILFYQALMKGYDRYVHTRHP